MNDEPVKWLLSLNLDDQMGLNIVWVFRRVWYRWHWRRPRSIERDFLDDV